MLDGDFDVLDSHPLYFVLLVNHESESLTENQSVVVASSPMRSVARAPAFIQFESEDKLTGKERVTGFRFSWFVSCWGQSIPKHGESSP